MLATHEAIFAVALVCAVVVLALTAYLMGNCRE